MTRGKSISIMIVSAILIALLLFAPFSIDGATGLVFSYTFMPIVGNNALPTYFAGIVSNLPAIIPGFPEIAATILSYFVQYGLYVILGILVFDIVFGFINLIVPNEVTRIIARVVSILVGIVLIFLTIFYLGVIATAIYIVASNGGDVGANILEYVKNEGFITTITLNIVCFISIFRQFRAFRI